MQVIDTREMSRIDWLKSRQRGIGGSDVAAVLGLSKYKTPLDVYNEKIADEPVDNPITPRMEAGTRLEDTVAKWWADENQFQIQKDNKIRIHDQLPFLLANIDRLILSSGNGRNTGVLEVKCTNQWAFKTWEDDGLPLDFYSQIQHYFNVTGYDWGAVAVLIGGWNLKSIDVVPDPEFIEMMTKRLRVFWDNHVVPRVPPEPTTDEEIKQLYPASVEGVIVEATDDTVDLIKQIRNVEASRKEFEEKEKALKVQLKAVIGEAERLTFLEQTLATYKSTKPVSSFDKKHFGVDHPDLLDEYTIEKPGYRRLLIKDIPV